MQGKLLTKSKVMQTMTSKFHVGKRKKKPERAHTPQRWSRRIRSLPPIPINVLQPRRKVKKKCTESHRAIFMSAASLGEIKKKNVPYKASKEKRKRTFNKSAPLDKSESLEVVRIVPVVVYVKNSTKTEKHVPEEIRVHINDNPACQMVSQIIDSHIHKKIKQKLSLRGEFSKMTARNSQGQNIHVMKKRYSSKKKLPLYH